MALLELTIDLKRTAAALERIADSLERISPLRSSEKSRPMKFINVDPAAIAADEEEEDRKREVDKDSI